MEIKANQRIYKEMTHEQDKKTNTRAHLQPIDWDFLIDKIREGKCLLVLGDEAFADNTGETPHTRLLKALDLPNNPNVKRYYPGDDFFLFEKKPLRTSFIFQFKQFYKNQQPGELISLLAEIPFHIYLTVTPDTMLPDAFKSKNYAYQHGFYKKNTDPQPIKSPTVDNPLIYNLFGCIENDESLLLSHDDLYDYFKSIFARKSMPIELKDELRNIHNLIFIGVPFDKWYLQILLREFELHNQNYEFTRFAANEVISNEISTLCFEQFQIQFVDRNVDHFVRELHRRVAEDKEIVFRKSVRVKGIKEEIEMYIDTGDADSAMEQLMLFCVDTYLMNEAIQLKSRYRRLTLRRIGGMIDGKELMDEESRIQQDILALAKIAATL